MTTLDQRATYNGRRVSNVTGFRILFIVWGLLGFLLAAFSMTRLWSVDNGITAVALSTYVSCGLLFWIGGMTFFGFADLLAKTKSE
jgi:uncharacterized membrane protein